ncbi:heme-binding protein [Flavobacteriaceae bacterium]|uniref:SOUL family heme-binding protein n=1 Tax=uncultured Wocania sp. TaxID=2834404 RepID=UPI002315480F|nr:heme-binding protein [Flavobacteriaceae bacterium]
MRTLFFILLSFYSMAQTETQSYEVLKNIAGCEIRFYPPVMMAKYTSDNGRSGFGKLFKYISGNNDGETKISMTTPVHMEKSESENSMAFVLPKSFNKENAPKPNDASLVVYESDSRHYAAIEYSGYTDEVKEKENTDKLKKILNEQNIEIVGDSKILVYNSPYKIVFRRNEILIPISYN